MGGLSGLVEWVGGGLVERGVDRWGDRWVMD